MNRVGQIRAEHGEAALQTGHLDVVAALLPTTVRG